MFMQIAIGAIGIGIVLMVGYVVVSQVQAALPTASTIQTENPCVGMILTTDGANTVAPCVVNTANTTWTAPTVCGTTDLSTFNASAIVGCENGAYATGTASVQVTVFAGFALIAVGIIVLAAFGLINVFK